jgi:hypothetical protein
MCCACFNVQCTEGQMVLGTARPVTIQCLHVWYQYGIYDLSCGNLSSLNIQSCALNIAFAILIENILTNLTEDNLRMIQKSPYVGINFTLFLAIYWDVFVWRRTNRGHSPGLIRNCRKVVKQFNRTHPLDSHITHDNFPKLTKKFRNTGSVADQPRRGRPRIYTDEGISTMVVAAFEKSPKKYRLCYGVSHANIVRIMKEHRLHPY